MNKYLIDANIFIQNVCIGLGIPFMNPYTMLRQEKAYFTLGTKNETIE